MTRRTQIAAPTALRQRLGVREGDREERFDERGRQLDNLDEILQRFAIRADPARRL